jgi:hypothetical protein
LALTALVGGFIATAIADEFAELLARKSCDLFDICRRHLFLDHRRTAG